MAAPATILKESLKDRGRPGGSATQNLLLAAVTPVVTDFGNPLPHRTESVLQDQRSSGIAGPVKPCREQDLEVPQTRRSRADLSSGARLNTEVTTCQRETEAQCEGCAEVGRVDPRAF